MKQSISEHKDTEKGFTLVEIIVALGVFITVMAIFSGSIFSVYDANSKSKNLRSVMDNMNLTLEDMTRIIRFATNYHCGNAGDLTQPSDCNGGANSLTVRSVGGVQTTFGLQGGRIVRTLNGANNSITSPDVTVNSLTFWVFGSPAFPDVLQPQVIIVIKGTVGAKNTSKTSFTLQTTVSQRKFDFQ